MTKNIIRRLYDWVLSWADSPYGSWALGLLAFAESSFFPVPPDILLIALAVSKPKGSFRYAIICSIGSIVGGILGYFLGLKFFQLLGEPILKFYGVMHYYYRIQELYQHYSAWAVGIAGFTPIPYKVFTIAAGAFKISFLVFLIASTVSRSARFFLVSALIWKFGEKIKKTIDKYFNLATIIFVLLLVGGFLIIKYLIK
jgi:membrane protein YqaA with SNARE-associated domain